MAETLFERWFEPDVVTALNNNAKMLKSISDQLALITGVSPIVENITTASGAKTSRAIEVLETSGFNAPMSYEDLLQVMLQGAKASTQPVYQRMTMVVPPNGMPMQMVMTVPSGETQSMVYHHTMTADFFSPDILVTHQVDNNPPLVDNAPLVLPIRLLGAFLPPIRSQMVHTVTNNSSQDVLFVADMQMVQMTDTYLRDIYIPLFTKQASALAAYAAEEGGASS
jgi:hypothetical protein